MKTTYQIIFFIHFILVSTCLSGQETNDLNQRITIEASNVTLDELLLKIGEQAKIKFSYNPKLIKSKRRVNVTAQNQSVRTVLDSALNNDFDYKLRGSYVIITKRNSSTELPIKDFETFLSGYIIDHETLDGIDNVSLYTSSGTSTLTDATGAFALKLKKSENSQIEIRKSKYQSKTIETNHNSNAKLEVKLDAIKSLSIVVHRDSLQTQKLKSPQIGVSTMYRINTSLQVNQENIKDSIRKPISFSLYPGLATYRNLSGNIEFNFALNFVGYNKGINGAEFSMLSSINKDNVKGLQLAGLSNYVGRNVKGYQAAGIFNKVGGKLNGIQMAGISNVNFNDVKGAQFAGVNNHVVGEVNGAQFSGILNRSRNLLGLQMAGVVNMADTISGAQFSGIANLAKTGKGIQMAAAYNQVDSISGAQVSGLINIARHVKGIQIGIINIADTITGIPVGIVNLIKGGYKRFGVQTDEIFDANLEFRSGVDAFHTVIRGGIQTDVFDSDNSFFTYGMGIGSRYGLLSGLSLDIDVTANHITKRKLSDDLSLNLKGYLGLELQLIDNFSIVGGATYNTYVFDRDLLSDEDFNSLRSKYISDTSDSLDDFIWRSWIGYNAGVRFVF